MPFIYPRSKGARKYNIRDFSHIDRVVREALKEVEEWDPVKGIGGMKTSKGIFILNTRENDPPTNKANPKEFLTLLCLSKGLNLGEVEKWLDYNFSDFTSEFTYGKTGLMYMKKGRIYYETPGGIPCSHILWHPERKEM